MIATCSPKKAQEWIATDPRVQVIDVREYPEYAGGHVPQARLISLGQVTERLGELTKDRPILVLCKGGKRATMAAEKLLAAGYPQVTVVEGGTDAWITAGLPVEKIAKAPWALERQVRLAAGALVVIGLFIPPWPYLSAFVGAGLVFAALTNTCGMGMMLARMPWNKAGASCPSGACVRK